MKLIAYSKMQTHLFSQDKKKENPTLKENKGKVY